MGCGATTLPSRSTPRRSASWAKMRRVSPVWTMGWNQLVKRPSAIWSSSQPACACTSSACSVVMRAKSPSAGSAPPAMKSARVSAGSAAINSEVQAGTSPSRSGMRAQPSIQSNLRRDRFSAPMAEGDQT